jgi:hypothetical protein
MTLNSTYLISWKNGGSFNLTNKVIEYTGYELTGVNLLANGTERTGDYIRLSVGSKGFIADSKYTITVFYIPTNEAICTKSFTR